MARRQDRKRRSSKRRQKSVPHAPPTSLRDEDALERVLLLLQAEFGIDFASYKASTVGRRIERRMTITGHEEPEKYIEHLAADRSERDALYKDLLIGVTTFFRDKEAFLQLEEHVLPTLFSTDQGGREIRIWVPGCATGEEAYSIAMLLHERATALNVPLEAKIFATDVHHRSLEICSRGIYSKTSVEELSTERLKRYFTQRGDGYHISKELRSLMTFAPHDITKDPPFTKMDLVSCRNMLIYLEAIAQQRVISLLHFALNPGGVLFLGPSENVGGLEDEFEAIDGKWKIYRKRRDIRLPSAIRTSISSPKLTERHLGGVGSSLRATTPMPDQRLLQAYDTLLERHMPASVLVTEAGELVHTFGDAGKFLSVPMGRASVDIQSLVVDDLQIALGTAMQRCVKTLEDVAYRDIPVKLGEVEHHVNLMVQPVRQTGADVPYFHVSFDEARPPAPVECDREDFDLREESRSRIASLEQELNSAQVHLRITVEELEASNEELRSTNEELHSVNAEYQKKIEELTQLTNDTDNLLRSTDVGTIFVDTRLCIRKFTPAISSSFNILPQDISRPIDHITHTIRHDDLVEDVKQVIETTTPIEREVTNRAGIDFLMRILPYYAGDDSVDGAVVTFIDITRLKQAEQALRLAHDELEVRVDARTKELARSNEHLVTEVAERKRAEKSIRDLVENAPDAMLMVSSNGEIAFVNSQLERMFGYSRDDLLEQPVEILIPVRYRDDHPTKRNAFFSEPSVRPMGSGLKLTGLRKGGTEFPVEISLGPLETADGLFVTAAIRDATETKRQQDALAEGEAYTRAILDTAADAIITIDEGGIVGTFNRAAENMFGFDADELIGQNVTALMPAPHRDEHDGYLHRYLETGEKKILGTWQELTGLRKDGTEFPMKLGATETKVGDRRWFTAIVRDLTVEKRQQRLIDQQKSRIRLLLDSTGEGIYGLDLQGNCTFCNPSCLRLLGYEDAEQLLGMNMHEVIHHTRPDGSPYPERECRIYEAFQKGEGTHIDDEVLWRADGSSFPAEYWSYPVRENGNVVGSVVTFVDITERKQAEALLRDSEQRVRQLLESAPDSMMATAEDGRIVMANAATGRVFGYATDELIGQPIEILLPERFRAKHVQQRAEYAHNPEIREKSCVTGMRKDGSEFPVEVNLSPMRAEEGMLVIASTRDITERKEAEAELTRLAADLQRSNDELTQFAYVASHDLKEPLRMVTSYTNLLAEDYRGKLDEDADRYVHYATDAARRMQELIDDLLVYSRLNRSEEPLQQVSLSESVWHVIADLEMAIEETGANVEVKKLPTVHGVRSRLHQLFQNLISNALKFRSDQAPNVSIDCQREGDYWHVRVADNGIGVDPEYFEHIFGVFQRLHAPGEYPGTGIGLAVCRKVVQQHGGEIWPESTPDQGTTMHFTLPVNHLSKNTQQQEGVA